MNNKKGIFNFNYLLLLQGNLVSGIGDVIYVMALGFWVLAETGSTALMGTLMASTALPRVLLSPFAGVIVDRQSRKKIIVLMDIMRGVAVLFVAVAALFGFLKIWMVFLAGIVIGSCAAFFSPAVNALIPEIVPESEVIRASSAHSSVHTVSEIIGNFVGGSLLSILGAPVIFLLNGITFVFSGISEMFIRVKESSLASREVTFFQDMKGGLGFVWNVKGIRFLFFSIAIINLCSSTAVVLFIPFFHKATGLTVPFLGTLDGHMEVFAKILGSSIDFSSAGKIAYGLVMAGMTLGMFGGFSAVAFMKIKPAVRFRLMLFFALLQVLFMTSFPFMKNVLLMCIAVIVYGFVLGVNNTFMMGSLQMTVPREKLGKVFGLAGIMGGGLAPVGMALGGVLAEFINPAYVISGAFALLILPYFIMGLIPSVRKFINFDPERQKREELYV